MTSVIDFNWRAERSAERSAERAEACREAFEAQVNSLRIADEWAAEICDTHPQVSRFKELIAVHAFQWLRLLYSTDDEAAIGSTFGACMNEDDFGDKWYADLHEAERRRECGDDESGY